MCNLLIRNKIDERNLYCQEINKNKKDKCNDNRIIIKYTVTKQEIKEKLAKKEDISKDNSTTTDMKWRGKLNNITEQEEIPKSA